MAISKNDFVEVEFTGNITGTEEIFDTNIEADARKAGMASRITMAVGSENVPRAGNVALVKFHGTAKTNLRIGGQSLC